MLTYGSLFTGAGGLEMGVQAVIPGRTLWHSEIDPGACKVLAHRWPDAPNLGDITTIDWAAVPRVDVLTGGFPCQDVSTAGARAGLKEGTRSGLFHEMMRAIDALRPSLVVIENVRGLLTAQGEPDPPDIEVIAATAAQLDRAVTTIHRRRARAVRRNQEQHVQHHTRDLFRLMGRLNRSLVALRRARRRLVRAIGTVVGRLADIGYDTQWYGLRAADVGAPHGRFRVFVFAWPASDTAGHPWRLVHGNGGAAADARSIGRGASNWAGPGTAPREGQAGGVGGHYLLGTDAAGLTLLPTPSTADGNGGHLSRSGERSSELLLPGVAKMLGELQMTLLPTPRSSDANGAGAHGDGGLDLRTAVQLPPGAAQADRWGKYAAAIARWERILGRSAPDPTIPGARTGRPRLNPQLVEWMMGWPPGHVTAVPGVTDVQALRIGGNGVVPQQAAAAARALLHDLATESAA
jgi:DNA (cytosine-5)-methyltransferase 1